MSGNWTKPTIGSLYADFVAEVKARDEDAALAFDPAFTTPTALPIRTVSWSSASNKWKRWDGTAWVDLTSTYAINISGTATNITGVAAAANGGTGQSSYTIGDLLFASGTTTLAKLADIASGNVLLSGGVGAAPFYGKVGLTTHVSGTLPVANGGTGVDSLSGVVFGNGAGAFTAATGSQIAAALGSSVVANAQNAANGGVTSVNGATGAVTVSTAWTSITGKPSSPNITGNWVWSGQSNLSYYWGSNDGVNFYPVHYGSMSVGSAGYAANAGNADTLDGYHASNLPYANLTAIVNVAYIDSSTSKYHRFTRANGTFFDVLTWQDSSGGGTCFPAGTLVLTGDAWVPIETICVGDLVSAGDGVLTRVLALWRPLLGDRTLYEIDSAARTTGDHMLRTPDGWGVIDPSLYADRRFGRTVLTESGDIFSHGVVQSPQQLVVGSLVCKAVGRVDPIHAIEHVPADPTLQLYTLITASGSFVVQGGYIVDGMPQEDK